MASRDKSNTETSNTNTESQSPDTPSTVPEPADDVISFDDDDPIVGDKVEPEPPEPETDDSEDVPGDETQPDEVISPSRDEVPLRARKKGGWFRRGTSARW